MTMAAIFIKQYLFSSKLSNLCFKKSLLLQNKFLYNSLDQCTEFCAILKEKQIFIFKQIGWFHTLKNWSM